MNSGRRDTNGASRLLSLIAWPVYLAVDRLHRHVPWARFPHSRKVWHCLVGFSVMLLGAWMAHALGAYLGTYLAETLGWAVHGMGLAPIAKVVEESLILD